MVNVKNLKNEGLNKGVSNSSDKILLTASRNIPFLGRHLMKDLLDIMPHIKTANKFNFEQGYIDIKEKCEERNVNMLVLFEENPESKENFFMWMSNESSNGPSIKFLIDNNYSINELKLGGDCLNGSKAILSFSSNFDEDSTGCHWKVAKNFLIKLFSTPLKDKKTKNVCDRILTFNLLGNRIWVRHYQINVKFNSIDEIGPRFALKPITIREGALTGKIIYNDENLS